MQSVARIASVCISAGLLQLPVAQASAALSVALSTETVGDSATYSPNLREGGFAAAQEIPRYTGNRVAIDWKVSERLSFESEIAQFHFATLRDRFDLNSFSLLARRTLAAATARKRTAFEFRVAGNYSDSIHKNSFTEAGDTLITGLTIDQPGDISVQAGFSHQRAFTSNSTWQIFSSVGHLRTRHNGVQGSATNNDCQYDFDFGTSGGRINQATPCGDVVSFSREYPDDSSLEQDLGISPAKDIAYSATMLKAGGGFSYKRNLWLLDINAYYQRYLRSGIDQRITASGNTSYESNLVFATKISRQATRRLSFSATVEYNQRQFLDQAPVLYNSFTADGFSSDALLFGLEVRYNLL